MVDSGADSVTPLNLAFSVEEFNMLVDGSLTGNSQLDDASSDSNTDEEEPGGEAETSSKTNLMSAYLNLPHQLKSCLDYCYFVLDNHVYYFNKRDKHSLGCLLLAEGLIKQDNSGSLMEDVASTVIDQLIGLGMLEKDYGSFNTVRIPSSYKKLGIGRVDTKSIFGKTPDSPIRLFITECGIEEDLYPNLSGLSVTSLFDCPCWYNNCIPRAYMETICKLKSLVVLVLTGDIECLPDEIGDLVHLKYLSLCYYKLENIPHTSGKSIEENSEMVFCNMDEPPVEELDIQRLWHLAMNTKTFKSKAGVPMKIGLRLNLHTLARIDARGGIMSELIKFTQLRRLEVYCVSDEHATELCAAIMNMTYLISLSMGGYRGIALFPELEAFSPPFRLQEVELSGGLVDIPSWILSMKNLSSFTLSSSYLDVDSIVLLQFLPNLEHLFLNGASKEKQIGEEFCQAGGFPKLETLCINSRILVEWTMIANGAFPSLRFLLLENCPNLIVFPDGLQNISTLDELHLWEIHGDLERRLQGIENYKINNIRKVVFRSSIFDTFCVEFLKGK